MIKVAVVEDSADDCQRLSAALNRFGEETGSPIAITHFPEATAFLDRYSPVYDIVFMDIEMPLLDGLEAAHRLREKDPNVILIFVTNLAQLAIRGYEVDALDYVVKPPVYESLHRKLSKALRLLEHNAEAVTISSQRGTQRVLIRDLGFIEVRDHKLSFHTEAGVLHSSGSLNEMEKRPELSSFLRCSKFYLVNPRHISGISGGTVTLRSGAQLSIGRAYKKAFMSALATSAGKYGGF